MNHKSLKDDNVINSNTTKQDPSINKTKMLGTIKKGIDKGETLQEH